MLKQNDTHHMGRRSLFKDYRLPGIYHITINVKERKGQPLGRVVGDVNKADGEADAPRVELTVVGAMVEQELTRSIARHYPMVEVQDYVIMPEHLHFIVVVHEAIVSRQGRITHLGQVIAGFKKGCNRRYWEIKAGGKTAGSTGQSEATRGTEPKETDGKTAGSTGPQEAGGGTGERLAVFPPGFKVPSGASTGRDPLFDYGYVDVMPLREGQLATQRRYIHNNPRSRLMRFRNRECLQPQRNSLSTALSLPALREYLQRECGMTQFNQQIWETLTPRLHTAQGIVVCDTYGNRELLKRPLLPVVCHRKDKFLFERQKQLCLAAAAEGAVLVSARIAKGEQDIIHAAIFEGNPVITVDDNGFAELYHPSEERMALCMENSLLIVTPWRFTYRHAEDAISVCECKAMNCVVQAICKKKDSWWKETD